MVIRNAPFLDDGTPMPTRYWLVDRRLREAVSRIESTGGVRRAEIEVDPELIASAHVRYAAERDEAVDPGHQGPRPSGGVGGTRKGVKCLHAHLAWYLAGGDDPVGTWTAGQLGLLQDPDVVKRGMTESSASSEVLAALDCGTNSTRLLIVGGEGEILDRQMKVTRLGEGVDTNRKLSAEAIERTLAVLREYRKSMDAHGVVRARMAATSAARDATNANDFLTAAREVTGVDPELLSGSQEGRLSFQGATSDLPSTSDAPELVVDIGGGSTELVVGVPGHEESLEILSLDIGCVRVTERFFLFDPPQPEQLRDARLAISEALVKARDSLSSLEPGGRVIGLAGTVSTLGSLSIGVPSYERDRVHHSVLTAEQVEWWLNALASETSSERAVRPGMDPGRADVIVGGVLILSEIMSVFDRATCLVSEADILDGLVASLR